MAGRKKPDTEARAHVPDEIEFERLLPKTGTVMSVDRATRKAVSHEITQLVLEDLLAVTKQFGGLITDFLEARDRLLTGTLAGRDEDGGDIWLSRMVERYSERVIDFVALSTGLDAQIVKSMTAHQLLHAFSVVMDLNFGGLEKNFQALWKRIPLVGAETPERVDLPSEGLPSLENE